MRKQLAIALATTALLLVGGSGATLAQAQQQTSPQMQAAPQQANPQPVTGTRSNAARMHRGSTANLTPQQIRRAQLALRRMGYNVRADGRMTPQTRRAIRQFHASRNIRGSGLDARTLAALGIATGRVQHARRPSRETTGAGTRSSAPRQQHMRTQHPSGSNAPSGASPSGAAPSGGTPSGTNPNQ
jgi:peptidoglycan hydrolase-like protein with peptidoglycan-binding domain